MYFAVMQLCPQRLLGHLPLSKWPQLALACEILGLHFVFQQVLFVLQFSLPSEVP